MKRKRNGFNKSYKGSVTNWLWRTRNKEGSNIALNMGDKINRNRTDRKESQFGGEVEELSARYLEVTQEIVGGHIP